MAVRISGVTIPNEKKVKISLTYIFGVGPSMARDILEKVKVDPEKRVKDLGEDEVKKLREEIEKKHRTEGDLKRDVLSNIKRLKEINSYRGSRHAKQLPARGQRTKTNSRTCRGNKKGMAVSGKKPVAQKT